MCIAGESSSNCVSSESTAESKALTPTSCQKLCWLQNTTYRQPADWRGPSLPASQTRETTHTEKLLFRLGRERTVLWNHTPSDNWELNRENPYHFGGRSKWWPGTNHHKRPHKKATFSSGWPALWFSKHKFARKNLWNAGTQVAVYLQVPPGPEKWPLFDTMFHPEGCFILRRMIFLVLLPKLSNC